MKYLNNPLNIRYNPANNWQGQLKPERGFCRFKTLYHGYRAAIRILQRYQLNGLNTVDKIINRWAPSSDGNDTKSYILFIKGELNLNNKPDYVINYGDYFELLQAMTRIEQGFPLAEKDKTELVKALSECLPKNLQ